MNYKTAVAVYLRKSRQDPDDESVEDTLSRHAETLLKFAAKASLNITAIYKEVISGDGLFTRPQMLKLLSDIEQKKYTAVLCMDIDRLGRSSQKDGGIILETFKENNVRIVTPQKAYDLNDDIDETSVEMQSFIARQELKAITRRLRRGMEKSLEDGCHIGDIPYGYRRAYIGKRSTLEIVPGEAEVIKLVFDMYVNQHLGSSSIADKLNAMGYRTKENKPFSRSSVRLFLANPVYTGKIVWNRKKHIKKKNINDKIKCVPNPPEKWIISEGLHPAIIDNETFAKAEEIRRTRSHPPAYTGAIKNPLAGLVYCKTCGAALVRQASKKFPPRLMCPTTGCNKSVELALVETRVYNIMQNLLNDIKANIIEKNKKPKQNRSDVVKKAITAAKKELSELYKQRNNLHDLLERGVYDIPTFLDRSKNLSERIKETEQNLDNLKGEIKSMLTAPTLESIIPTLEHLLNDYDTLSPAEKNTLYKRIIKRIEYYREKHVWDNDFDISLSLNFEI